MRRALDKVPPKLSNSKDSWQQQVFTEWMHRNYANSRHGEPEWQRMAGLWAGAVHELEACQGLAVQPHNSLYGHYDDGITAEQSVLVSPVRTKSKDRSQLDITRAFTQTRVDRAGDKTVVSLPGNFSARFDREVKPRNEVGTVQKVGVGVRNMVVHSNHEDATKTIISRVGGGYVKHTIDEEWDELLINIHIPASYYSEEAHLIQLIMDPDDTIKQLKEKIYTDVNIPPSRQRLYSDKLISGFKKDKMRKFKRESWTLQDYQIEDGDTIMLKPHSGWTYPWWLLVLTVFELALVHWDNREPKSCANILDANTKNGQCDQLLRSGEFSCEHDFCPCETPHVCA